MTPPTVSASAIGQELVQRLYEARQIVTDCVPEYSRAEVPVGVNREVAQVHHLPPGNLRMAAAHLRRDVVCGFTDDGQVVDDGVDATWPGAPRIVHSLRGMDRFSQKTFPQRRLDAVAQYQIDPRNPEDALKVVLGSGEVKEPDRPAVELHEQIDITGGGRLVADDGSEKRQGLDAEVPGELFAMVCNDLEDSSAVHLIASRTEPVLASARERFGPSRTTPS